MRESTCEPPGLPFARFVTIILDPCSAMRIENVFIDTRGGVILLVYYVCTGKRPKKYDIIDPV
jgi:hypothetical protein